MPNIIDSIQISSSTFDVRDKSATTVVNLTQEQYDNLPSSAKTANVLYNITDATAGDLSQYWTSAQTQSAITEATSGKADTIYVDQSVSGKVDTSTFETYSGNVETALSGKQDTLISGTNIKTINNESILGSGNITIQGGGKAISGGTNISITTGETADTINCTLPIYSGINLDGTAAGAESIRFSTQTSFGSSKGLRSIRGRYNSNALGEESICFGVNSYVRGDYSFGVGRDFDSYGNYTTIFGYGTQTKNIFETAIGKHNTSNSGSTDADNTLFSVGNGASTSARHNAFEIRQNGDIYISSGGTDILLQDQLGGGGGSITIDPSLNSGSTNPVANSAITTAFKNTDYVTTSFSSENLDLVKKDPFDTSYRTVVAFGKINGSAIASSYSSLRPSFSLVETSAITTSISSSSTDSQVPSAKAVYDALGSASGGISSAECQSMIDDSISGKADTSSLATVATSGSYDDLTNKPTIPTVPTSNTAFTNDAGYLVANDISGKTDTSAFTAHTADTTIHTTSAEKASWDGAATNASNAITALGGLKLVKLTQSAYDALTTKDSNTLYVIVN